MILDSYVDITACKWGNHTMNLGLVIFVNHAGPFRASHNECHSTDSENVIWRFQHLHRYINEIGSEFGHVKFNIRCMAVN